MDAQYRSDMRVRAFNAMFYCVGYLIAGWSGFFLIVGVHLLSIGVDILGYKLRGKS